VWLLRIQQTPGYEHTFTSDNRVNGGLPSKMLRIVPLFTLHLYGHFRARQHVGSSINVSKTSTANALGELVSSLYDSADEWVQIGVVVLGAWGLIAIVRDYWDGELRSGRRMGRAHSERAFGAQ